MSFNIAARAGRWSAAHWKTAVSAWLAFCVVAIALGGVAGTKMLKEADTAAGGSKHAEQILKRELATGAPVIYRLNADSTVASKLDLAA